MNGPQPADPVTRGLHYIKSRYVNPAGAPRERAFEGRPPAPVSRAAVYREVAERLEADARRGIGPGWLRIFKRGAARKVRAWADELV